MTQPRAHRRDVIQSRALALAGTLSTAGVRAAAAAAGDEPDNTGPKTAELWLYGVVGGFWWGFSSDSVSYALRRLDDDVDEIIVRLDSPGGNAVQGLAIANLLANHPAKVTIVVDGLAASAASQIALAGDLVMSPGSQMMLHDAWMLTVGNAAELKSDAEWLDKQSQNYAETYAHRAGETAEHWREVMLADNGRGTWFTAAEAVAAFGGRVGNIASTTPPQPEPEPDEDDDEEASARAQFDLEVLVAPSVRAAWSDRLAAHARGPKPPSASAVGSTHTEGGPAVAFSDEQLTTMRASLELEETADEAAILAAVQAVVAENLEERPAPTAPAIPEGHVVIPKAQLDDLTAGAKLAQKTAKDLQDRECKALLDDNRAKYLPTTRAAWEAEYARDPQAVRDHFAKAPDIIPTSELGHAETSEDDAIAGVADADLDSFAASLGLSKEDLRG